MVTVFVFSGLMHLVDPVAYASPLAHLFTGGLMLGAIFMATDYVTSPMTHKGMIIYGVAIGFDGGYPFVRCISRRYVFRYIHYERIHSVNQYLL